MKNTKHTHLTQTKASCSKLVLIVLLGAAGGMGGLEGAVNATRRAGPGHAGPRTAPLGLILIKLEEEKRQEEAKSRASQTERLGSGLHSVHVVQLTDRSQGLRQRDGLMWRDRQCVCENPNRAD